jgi:hypothetical protein
MGRQIRQVLITFITHRWIMAIIAAWLALIVVPQLILGGLSAQSPTDLVPMVNTLMGMPLLFLSIMLVPQAKAQFAHSRAALMPGFVLPHIVVLGVILLLLVIVFPLAVGWCCRFDSLGITTLAAAIVTPLLWAVHFNRMWGMVVGLAVFYSTMTTSGAEWWLIEAASHRPIHVVILLACLGMILGWLVRLCRLREEMDDYQTTVHWHASRKSGTEVSEQRRIVAEQVRRSKLASFISDAWLSRVGGYHGDNWHRLARLLRFGFGQPAELTGLFMAVWFFAITLFLAKYSFAQNSSGFNAMLFYIQVAMLFPGMFAGEWLAQRRPRIAVELLLPLSRERLVGGLFAATAWNAAAFWLVLNVVLVLLLWLTAKDLFTPAVVGLMLLLTGSGAFGLGALSLRTAVWTSVVKRLGVLMITMFLFQAPLLAWSLGREKLGDALFVLPAAVLCGVGVLFANLARRAWLNVELG